MNKPLIESLCCQDLNYYEDNFGGGVKKWAEPKL